LIASQIFDRVVIREDTGAPRTLSAKQFLALPLHVRIQHILARDVQFFRGQDEVDRASALKSLRR
jgi:hypothetical protein